MEVIFISIAFLFLVLICGGCLTALSFIVYRNNAQFNSNMSILNTQMSAAYTEFKAGIEASQKLAEDLNVKLNETQEALATSKTLNNRLDVVEHAVRLNPASRRNTGLNA